MKLRDQLSNNKKSMVQRTRGLLHSRVPFGTGDDMQKTTNPLRGTKILPPTFLLISMITMLALNFFLPVLDFVPEPWILLGILPMGLGIGFNIISDKLFSQARTTVNSFGEPTAMITESIYSITRNPMYLGMLLVLTGVAVLLGSLSPFLVIPAFVWLINVRFIKFEEQKLEDKFGLKWLDYAERVRRWI